MEHFVTLFDTLFIPQGVALYLSMERHITTYTLWVLCIDDNVHEVLTKLALPNIRLLKLSQLETPELLAVKSARSKGEYCWTLTPFSIRFVFETDHAVSRVTYIDADMWFRKNPAPIFREFDESGKQVLITDHAYAPEHDQSATSGQFCVQFITFKRVGGECVRKWWEERCIEWCFDRFEDGKFGDQKYLDEWPVRFDDSVHVLKDKELLQAPWNATRFPFATSIVWHFHSARVIVRNNHFHGLWTGSYPLPPVMRKNVYRSYCCDLVEGLILLTNVVDKIISQQKPSIIVRCGLFIRGMWRLMWRIKFGTFIRY